MADVWSALSEAVEAARSDATLVRKEKVGLEEEATSLRAALSEASADAESLRAQLAESELALQVVRAELDSSREETARVVRRVARRDASLKEATNELSVAKLRCQQAEDAAQELRDELGERRAALDRVTRALHEKESSLQATRDELRALSEELAAAKADIARRANANEGLRRKVAERDDRLAEISARCTHDGAALSDVSNLVVGAAANDTQLFEHTQAKQPASAAVSHGGGGGGAAALHAVDFARRVLEATRTDASGTALEELTRRVFLALGYDVPPRQSGPGDRGIDLRVFTADDALEIVQCKSKGRGKTNVSFSEMSEFIGAMELADCTTGHFVTNSGFTASALHAARSLPSKQVVTIGAEELAALLHQHHSRLRHDHHIISLLEAMPGRRMDYEEAAAMLQRAARRRSSLGGVLPPQPLPATAAQHAARRAPPAAAVEVGSMPRGGGSSPGVRRSPGFSSATPPLNAPPSQGAGGVSLSSPPMAADSEGVAPRSAGGSKARLPFSGEEEMLLCRLWHEKDFARRKLRGERYKWKEILDEGRHTFHPNRTPGDLKDKARNIGLLQAVQAQASDVAAAAAASAAVGSAAVGSTAPIHHTPPRAMLPPMQLPERIPRSPWDACMQRPPGSGGCNTAETTPSPHCGAMNSECIDLRLDESSSSSDASECC